MLAIASRRRRASALERLAAAEDGVAAGVAQPQPRVQDGRHAGRAGAQPELHVLGEQVHGGVEGAEPAQRLGVGRQARGDRPADGPRADARGRARRARGAVARQQRRVHERRQERAERPGQRVG